MDRNISIRAVGPEEADLIVPLLEVVQSVHSSARPDIFRADTDRGELSGFLKTWLAKPGMTALAALHPDGNSRGYLIFEIQERDTQPLHRPNRRGFLHHVCVDPSTRRAGIATALVDEMRRRLRDAGIERVATAYWAFNDVSAALMARLGFVPFRVVAESLV